MICGLTNWSLSSSSLDGTAGASGPESHMLVDVELEDAGWPWKAWAAACLLGQMASAAASTWAVS